MSEEAVLYIHRCLALLAPIFLIFSTNNGVFNLVLNAMIALLYSDTLQSFKIESVKIEKKISLSSLMSWANLSKKKFF